MSVVPVFGRAVAKIARNMALRCLKTSTFRPLRPTRIIQHRSIMARSISGTAAVYPVIPTVELQHESEIPNADVMRRLNMFSSWCEEPQIRETDYRPSRDQWRDVRRVWRQQALELSPRKNEGGTIMQSLVRETGWEDGAGQKCFEQEEHGTVIGSELRGGESSEDVSRRHDGDGEQRRE